MGMAPEALLPGGGAIELSPSAPPIFGCSDLDFAAPAREPKEPPQRRARLLPYRPFAIALAHDGTTTHLQTSFLLALRPHPTGGHDIPFVR